MQLKQRTSARLASGFTLIEMIGVLAVIAILAALLLPKIFEAINSSRINNAVVSYNTMKTAIMDHYGKYGKFDTIAGTTPITIPATGYGGFDTNVLLPEQLIDKAFQVKVGTNWTVQLRTCEASTVPPASTNSAYALAGNTATNDASGQLVVECVISGVAEQDAIEISKRLDGDALSNTTIGTVADTKGRVKYTTPSPAGGLVDVYMYVAHR